MGGGVDGAGVGVGEGGLGVGESAPQLARSKTRQVSTIEIVNLLGSVSFQNENVEGVRNLTPSRSFGSCPPRGKHTRPLVIILPPLLPFCQAYFYKHAPDGT